MTHTQTEVLNNNLTQKYTRERLEKFVTAKFSVDAEKGKREQQILTNVLYVISYDTWQLRCRKSGTRDWSRRSWETDWATRASIRPATTWAATTLGSGIAARWSSSPENSPVDVVTARCAESLTAWWVVHHQSLLLLTTRHDNDYFSLVVILFLSRAILDYILRNDHSCHRF